MISGVKSTDARRIWPAVEPILERAVRRTNGRLSTGAVLTLIEQAKMQLWVSGDDRIKAVAVTELLAYPHAWAARIVLAAGELRAVLDGGPYVEGWAREHNCTSIEIEGRPGWERVAPAYKLESVILRKALT